MVATYQASGTTVISAVSTSWVLTLPAGVTQGDVLVLGVNTNTDHVISAWPGTTYTAGMHQWDPGDPQTSVGVYVVPASPPTTITITLSTGSDGHLTWLHLRGVLTATTPVDVTAQQTASSGDVTTLPSVTTTGTDRFIVGGAIVLGNGTGTGRTWTGPTGWTTTYATSSVTPTALLASKGLQSAAGATGAATATVSGAAIWSVGWTLALKSASSTNNTPPTPTANAGVDQSVEPWVEVFLTGTSTDPSATYVWTQTAGTTVQRYGFGANQSFYAPAALAGATLTFQLAATNASGTGTDTVTVTVAAPTQYAASGSAWVPMRVIHLGTEVVTVPSAPTATLTSNFATFVGFTGSGGAGPAASNNQLLLLAEPGYPTLASNARYDLTNSSIYARLVQAPNIGNGSTQTRLRLADSVTEFVEIGWGNGGLVCNQAAAGTISGFTTTYTAGTDVWLRISHNGTNVVWATSTDKTTWNTKRTAAPTIALTRLQVQLTAGNFNAEPTPGTAIWDNLNL